MQPGAHRGEEGKAAARCSHHLSRGHRGRRDRTHRHRAAHLRLATPLGPAGKPLELTGSPRGRRPLRDP
eukprot:8053391-Alexandrium_andersonii.AAC.1